MKPVINTRLCFFIQKFDNHLCLHSFIFCFSRRILSRLVSTLGLSISQSDAHANAQWVAALFATLDADADGRISFVEFQHGVLTPQVHKRRKK